MAFQFKSPDAQSVDVDITGKKFPMTRGNDGIWSIVTPPLVVGFHYYALDVDGVRMNDPSSHTYFGTGKDTSGMEVPEDGVDYYRATDVPHGDCRHPQLPLEDHGPVAALLCLHAARL